MNQKLVQKLTSRKFWALIVTFVTSLLVVFNFNESEITQIAAIISTGGAVVAYILGESYIDGKREETKESGGDE